MATPLEDQVLDAETVKRRIEGFNGWKLEDGALRKKFEYPTFLEAIAFVNRVAVVAEKLDHHPDFEIHWRRLTLSCWTHKHDALTAADVALVQEIESVA